MTRGDQPDDLLADVVPEPPRLADAQVRAEAAATVVPEPPGARASGDDVPGADAEPVPPASRRLAGVLAGRRARLSLPSVSLPSVSLPSVSMPDLSLPSVSLPSVRVPRFGRRSSEPGDVGVAEEVDVPVLPDAVDEADVTVPEPPVAEVRPLEPPDLVGVVPLEPPGPVDAPGSDLLLALEDALEEAVALDPADPDGEAEPEDEDEPGSRFLTAWVARAIEAYPRPSYPMEREWDVSIQGIVRLVPFLPRFATAPLGLLDRFGAVTVGPQRVGLDGKDVPWDRVVEVRTEPAWTRLSAEALEVDIAQFVTVIPPIPGRGWVLRRVSELLLSLYLAVLPPDDGEIDLDDPEDELLTSRVVTAVRYRRRFGHGEASVGAASTLLQLALPGTVDTIVRTARAHDVPVRHVPTAETDLGKVVQRAAAWRSTAAGMRDDLATRWKR